MIILGADECGYGSCAGPLVVCGVIQDESWTESYLVDSKKLTYDSLVPRVELLLQIPDLKYKIASRTNVQIDAEGLGVCLRQCYFELFSWGESLGISKMMVDGNLNFDNSRIESHIKGDSIFPTIMAASMIGKVTRDQYMKLEIDPQYPEYGFKNHVGYLTKEHKAALVKHGFSDIHRKSYKIKGFNK